MYNKNKLLWIVIFQFFLYSCNAQDEVLSNLRKCVKSKTDSKFLEIYGDSNLDVYKMVDSIEQELLSKNILKEISKNEYVKLYDNISKKDTNIINNKLIDKYYSISGLLGLDLSACNYEIIITEKNELNASVVNQFKILQDLSRNGDNRENILELINETHDYDFKHIEYRTLIMVVILSKITEIKYPTNRERRKTSKKEGN